MLVAHRRGAILVAHPDHAAFLEDLVERLMEDTWWQLGTGAMIDQPALMMFKKEVPFDVMLFWTESGGLQTPAQFIGKTGFGRLTAAAPSANGVRPWATAQFKGNNRLIELIKQREPGDDGDLH
jgi:hypothetical protein